jgi:hypothetical protein
VRERTAWHEAGHAAALVLLGGVALEASIRGDESARGWVDYIIPDEDDVWAVMALAGPLAVLRWEEGWSPEPGDWLRVQAEQHLQDVTNALADGDPASEAVQMMVLDAWELMRHPLVWACVEWVAEALLDQHELTGEQISRLIDAARLDPEIREEVERYNSYLAEMKAELVALTARMDQLGAKVRDVQLHSKGGGR